MFHLKDEFFLFLPVAGAGWGRCLCSGWYRKDGYSDMEERE